MDGLLEQKRWVSDKEAASCMDPSCATKFTLLTRKHHCRVCGQIFCDDCCPKAAQDRMCAVCAKYGTLDLEPEPKSIAPSELLLLPQTEIEKCFEDFMEEKGMMKKAREGARALPLPQKIELLSQNIRNGANQILNHEPKYWAVMLSTRAKSAQLRLLESKFQSTGKTWLQQFLKFDGLQALISCVLKNQENVNAPDCVAVEALNCVVELCRHSYGLDAVLQSNMVQAVTFWLSVEDSQFMNQGLAQSIRARVYTIFDLICSHADEGPQIVAQSLRIKEKRDEFLMNELMGQSTDIELKKAVLQLVVNLSSATNELKECLVQRHTIFASQHVRQWCASPRKAKTLAPSDSDIQKLLSLCTVLEKNGSHDKTAAEPVQWKGAVSPRSRNANIDSDGKEMLYAPPFRELASQTSLRERPDFLSYKFVGKAPFGEYVRDIQFRFKESCISNAEEKARAVATKMPNLCHDELSMIALYTSENSCGADNFSARLNQALRRQEDLGPWMDVIFLLDSGLRKLPNVRMTVSLQTKFTPASGQYVPEKTILVWNQFLSTTSRHVNLSSGTNFVISMKDGKDISPISLHPSGKEILLPLCSQFVVNEGPGNEIRLTQQFSQPVLNTFYRSCAPHGAQSLFLWSLMQSACLQAILFQYSEFPEMKAHSNDLKKLLREFQTRCIECSNEKVLRFHRACARLLAYAYSRGIDLTKEQLSDMAREPEAFLGSTIFPKFKDPHIVSKNVGKMGKSLATTFDPTIAVKPAFGFLSLPPELQACKDSLKQAIADEENKAPMPPIEDLLRDLQAEKPGQVPYFVDFDYIFTEEWKEVTNLKRFEATLPLQCHLILLQQAQKVLVPHSASVEDGFFRRIHRSCTGVPMVDLHDKIYQNKLERITNYLKHKVKDPPETPFLVNMEIFIVAHYQEALEIAGEELTFQMKSEIQALRKFCESVSINLRIRFTLAKYTIGVIMGLQKCGKSTFFHFLGGPLDAVSGGVNTRDISVVSIKQQQEQQEQRQTQEYFHMIDCPALTDKSPVIVGLTNLVVLTADVAVALISATNINDHSTSEVFKMLAKEQNENGLATVVVVNRCDELYENLKKDLVRKAPEPSDDENEKKLLKECGEKAGARLLGRLEELCDELAVTSPVVGNMLLIASCLEPTAPLNVALSSFDTKLSYNAGLTPDEAVSDFRVSGKICASRGVMAAFSQTLACVNINYSDWKDNSALTRKFKRSTTKLWE